MTTNVLLSTSYLYANAKPLGQKFGETFYSVGNAITKSETLSVSGTVSMADELEKLLRAIPSGYATAAYLAQKSNNPLQETRDMLETNPLFKRSHVISPSGDRVYMIRGSKSWLSDALNALADFNYRLSRR